MKVIHGRGPEPAALPIGGWKAVADCACDTELTRSPGCDEEDVVQVRLPPAREVPNVVADLLSNTLGRFGAAIPFEEEQDLPVTDQIATPAVRSEPRPPRAVDTPTGVLSHPRLETFAWDAPAGGGEQDEQAVGFQVVDYVSAMRPGVLAARQ